MSGKSAMIDISDALISARADTSWTLEVAEMALHNVAQQTGTRLQWEEAAGEDWGTFLRDREFVGMLSISVCLGVTIDNDMADVMRSAGVAKVLVVDTFRQPSMCCALPILTETFKYDHGWGHPVDPAAFSAEELWWATI